MELSIVKPGNEQAGTVSVSDVAFAKEYNEDLVHQVVTAYLAGARQGTRAQKNRSAVAVMAVVSVITVAFQPGLLDRFSLSSITDTTGAGRTAAWGDLFGDLSVFEWIFGSVQWGGPCSRACGAA